MWVDIAEKVFKVIGLRSKVKVRILIARPRLHSMQRGKNQNILHDASLIAACNFGEP